MQPSPITQVPVMQQYEAGLAALLGSLAAMGLTVQTQVEVLPENKAGLEDALDGARVTIAYRQSEFGEGNRGGGQPFYGGLGSPAAQEETLHADVFVRARGRSNSKGVYQVIEAVRYLLMGKVPFPGARGVWFTGQQLDDFEERGVWRYMLSVATSTVLVSSFDSAEQALQAVSFALTQIQGTVLPPIVQIPFDYGTEKEVH